MTGIIDYGVGNVFSLRCSLAAIGEKAVMSSDADELFSCDRLILPGVGAFEDAAKRLHNSGLEEAIELAVMRDKPLLGICLGMQLLFDKSFEYGEHRGLGLIPGEIVPLEKTIPEGLNIPQMGWNQLIFSKSLPSSPIYKYVNNGESVYFVHSYYASCDEAYVSAYTEYGADITASCENGNIYGTQFHPEKSGKTGLNILRAFCEI